MMKRLFQIALLVAMTAAIDRVAAQESAFTQQPAVEELSEEVAALDKRLTAWEKVVKALPKISGYMQLRYQYSDDASTFDIKRVRLDFQGEISEKVDYRLQLELSSPKIVDAYVRYKPFNALNVQVGQFKVPFSIENTDYPPLKLETIEYPMALQQLMGFSEICGISATGRDLGAQLYGGFLKRDGYSIISYNLGVFDGQGINVKDANKSKDVAARLSIRPIKPLLLSASYYWGEFSGTFNGQTTKYLGRKRYGFGVGYDDGRAVARAEYIGGKTGAQKSDGYYALLGYRVGKNWQPVVRFDTFRENSDVDDTRETDYLVGINWLPLKHLRLQLNYTCKTYEMSGVSNANVVGLMVTGMF